MSERAIIFDLDGTVRDSFKSHVAFWKYLAPRSKAPLNFDVKEKVQKLFRENKPYNNLYNAMGFTWETDSAMIIKEYEVFLAKQEIPLFQGMEELLQELKSKNIGVGLATNSTRPQVSNWIQKYNIEFRCIVTVSDVKQRKPNPEMLFACAESMRINPKKCIYVGDEITDKIAAENAKMQYVHALHGFDGDIESEHKISNAEELKAKLDYLLSLD